MKSSKSIDVRFIFHNIGQGLFYSGKVGNFKFIYDCGVENGSKHLTRVVNSYARYEANYGKTYLDLLILSHLHKDHVSGLNQLFKSGVEVDTVILPYLTPIERLMVAFQKPTTENWLFDFWADPVTFLIENGVGRVILLGGTEGFSSPDKTDEKGTNPDIDPTSDSNPKKINYDLMQDDIELEKKVMDNDPQLQRYFTEKKVLTKNHNKNLLILNIWLFRFFNYKLEDAQQKTFESCITNNCNISDLNSLIRNKSSFKKLKFCYKILKGDFNDTSLVVYHGPIENPKKLQNLTSVHNLTTTKDIMENCFFTNYHYHPFNTTNPESLINIGQLLTGDINLNTKWEEIAQHFAAYFSKIGVVLVPHHGSIKNWNSNLLSKIYLSNPNSCIWIASAGINNKYRHPSFDVMQDISRLAIPFYCNEIHGLKICSRLNL